jgi:Zn-dependent protease
MLPTRQGSLRLFRFAGVDVFLHWSWFVVALIEIEGRTKQYSSPVWNALEYVALFLIVLLHEFGHALACRSVGGRAETIVLWPLGGVAFVAPPPRPGAMLWSIAAGPLVNVILAPGLTALTLFAPAFGWAEAMPNAYALVRTVCYINYALLIFNLLPIYPLDGGQILRSLLWFVVGRARSLMITSIIGLVGVVALLGLAFVVHSVWIGIISVFILLNCWRGLMQARLLARAARLPRHEGFVCPECKEPAVRGPFWRCAKCLKPFDTFEHHAVCPNCGTEFPVTACPLCGSVHPMGDWAVPVPVPPAVGISRQ